MSATEQSRPSQGANSYALANALTRSVVHSSHVGGVGGRTSSTWSLARTCRGVWAGAGLRSSCTPQAVGLVFRILGLVFRILEVSRRMHLSRLEDGYSPLVQVNFRGHNVS